MAVSMYRCPSCGKLFGIEFFNCPDCEEILNHTLVERAPDPPRESTLVRRMLAPDGSLDRPDPTFPGKAAGPRPEITSPTVRMPYPEPTDGIPALKQDLKLDDLELTVYEAFVVSRIDGRTSLEALRLSLELSKLEVQVVLNTLKEKGVVHVMHPPAPPPLPKRSASPPQTTEAESTPAAPPHRQETGASHRVGKSPPPLPKAHRPRKQAEVEFTPPPVPSQFDGRSYKRVEIEPGSPFLPIRDMAHKTDEQARPPGPPPEGAIGSPLRQAIELEASGDHEAAIRVLERAIKASERPAPLYNRLALVLIKERRDYLRAEELLNQAVELAPNNQTYRNNLAKVLMMIASSTGLSEMPKDSHKW